MDELNARIQKWYVDFGVSNRMPPLKYSNLVSPSAEQTSFPELHGPAVKAANTKALVDFGLLLASELCDGTVYKKRRWKVFRALARFNEIIEGQGMFMTDAALSELQEVTHSLLLNYSWLASEAAKAGQVAWGIKPKHHYLAHIPYQAQLLNPRYVRNYLDEPMIGTVTGVWKGSKFGPFRKAAQKNVLSKYLLAVQLQFSPYA